MSEDEWLKYNQAIRYLSWQPYQHESTIKILCDIFNMGREVVLADIDKEHRSRGEKNFIPAGEVIAEPKYFTSWAEAYKYAYANCIQYHDIVVMADKRWYIRTLNGTLY